MSYDVDLTIDTGSGEPVSVWSRNHTSNTARMWRAAGCDLAEFDGKPASELTPVVTAAITDMCAHPGAYRTMNPPNGWGDYESTLEFLRAIRDACMDHSLTTVRVSR